MLDAYTTITKFHSRDSWEKKNCMPGQAEVVGGSPDNVSAADRSDDGPGADDRGRRHLGDMSGSDVVDISSCIDPTPTTARIV